MKKILSTTLLITLSTILCFSQTSNFKEALWGFTIQTSSDSQFLKVTNIVPGSLANLSGLRIGDRIYQIADKKVSEITDPIINLNEYSGPYLKLKINRLAKFIDIDIPLIQSVNSFDDYLTEGILYEKLETGDKMPNWIVGDNKILSLLSDNTKDFFKYKTYDFEYSSQDEPLLEKKVFEELGKQLNELGLSRSLKDPDLLILMKFFSGNKEKYTPPQQIITTRIEKSYNWYWGYIPVPITESKTIAGKTTVIYILTLNIKFLDANEIKTSEQPPVVWQGSMTQTSLSALNVIDECKDYFEVLLYQFPEVWKEIPKTYITPYYKYTGILYDKKDINVVFDVIHGSPAEIAGIKKGDKILSVDGNKIPSKYQFIIDGRYMTGIQTVYQNESNVKYANNVGSGFKYLLSEKETTIQAIKFIISREGEKMNFIIIPIKKRLIQIYNK